MVCGLLCEMVGTAGIESWPEHMEWIGMGEVNKMTEKINKDGNRRRIDFVLEMPSAMEVVLLGDFNRWDQTGHPMKRCRNGIWKKSLLLAPGTYEYKFKVDGNWLNDPGNALTCDNCFGTKNSFVVVPDF